MKDQGSKGSSIPFKVMGYGKLLGVLRSSSPGSRDLVPVPVPQCPRNGPSPRFSWQRFKLPFNLTPSDIGDAGASS